MSPTALSENAGVNSPVYTPGGNTDPNLSDYTLSFDMAITPGANSGVGVTLNIFGTGAANGSSYAVPISQNHRRRRVRALFGQYGHITCGVSDSRAESNRQPVFSSSLCFSGTMPA